MGAKISIADAFYDRCCTDYTLKYNDPGRFQQTTLGRISSYRIENVGYVTLARSSALFMKREGCVFVPVERDAPMLLVDHEKKPGSEILAVNLVKSQLVPLTYRQFERVEEGFGKLADADISTAWYNGELLSGSLAKKAKNDELAGVLEEYLNAYLHIVEFAEKCDPVKKAEKNAEFSHGLLEKGGLAADHVQRVLGAEDARELFDTIVFPLQ